MPLSLIATLHADIDMMPRRLMLLRRLMPSASRYSCHRHTLSMLMPLLMLSTPLRLTLHCYAIAG